MPDTLGPLQVDALVNLCNMWMDKGGELLATMTNRPTSITGGAFSLTSKEELEKNYPMPRLIGELSIPPLSFLKLFMTAQDAAVIVDLVIGGDGKGATQEMSDLHISVAEEAFNEMSNAMAELLTTFLGSVPKPVPIKARVNGLEGFAGKSLAMLTYTIQIEGLVNGPLNILLEAKQAEDLSGKLLNLAPAGAPAAAEAPPKQEVPVHAAASGRGGAPGASSSVAPARKAEAQTKAAPAARLEEEVVVQPVQYPPLKAQPPRETVGNLDLILDVPLQLTAVLGKTGIQIKDLITLGPGSVLELDKVASEPVELYVNNKLVARGEVVVIDEKFGVRVTETISPQERIQGLQGG